MLRSELIAILQQQTEEHGRDGDVRIWVYGQNDDPQEDPIDLEIISTNCITGWSEAISIIDAGRSIEECAKGASKPLA